MYIRSAIAQVFITPLNYLDELRSSTDFKRNHQYFNDFKIYLYHNNFHTFSLIIDIF